MNKKIILYFLTATFCSLVAKGQNDSSACLLSCVLNKVNKNLNDIKNGGFKLTYKFKPGTDEDTVIYTADCKFYKNMFKDEIADFIIYADSQPRVIYQDKKIYQIFNKERKILKKDVYKYDLNNFARGNADHELIFIPYLKVGEPLFDSVFYSDYKLIRIFNHDKHSFYEIHKSNEDTDNVVANIPGDMNVKNVIEKIYIDSASLFVRKKIDELDFNDMHQYIEYELSDIVNLGANARPEFPINDLLQKYTVYDNEADLSKSYKKVNALVMGNSVSLDKIKTITGDTFDLQNCNSRLILFDFWYKSCYPCMLSVPHLNELRNKFNERDILIVGINPYDKDINKLKAFIQKKDISYFVVIDSLSEITDYFGVASFPSLFLIDAKTKKIIYTYIGFDESEFNEMADRIKSILN